MTDSASEASDVVGRRDLIEWLEAGCKPRERFRVGVEHEKIGFRIDDLSPPPYEGERGVRALLEAWSDRFGWRKILENGRPIALSDDRGAGITLEPGGQFELSGAPLSDLHATRREMRRNVEQTREVAEPLGLDFLTLGGSPLTPLAEIPRMPKERYRIIAPYMATKGWHGVDMMHRSCTAQVNLDFSSEEDMRRKMRTASALQPIASAVFANSPLSDGRENGFLSYRAHCWGDVDADRSGVPDAIFEDGFGFERFVDYALSVPMYFVRRGGRMRPLLGESFSDLLDGRLELDGERLRPRIEDWEDHAGAIFTDVRLKRFLEMRGADAGDADSAVALAAFWIGILEHDPSLAAAESMTRTWDAATRRAMRRDAPLLGFRGRIGESGLSFLEAAAEATSLAREGLKARRILDDEGEDETRHLAPIEATLERGTTPAEEVLRRFRGEWKGNPRAMFEALRFR